MISPTRNDQTQRQSFPPLLQTLCTRNYRTVRHTPPFVNSQTRHVITAGLLTPPQGTAIRGMCTTHVHHTQRVATDRPIIIITIQIHLTLHACCTGLWYWQDRMFVGSTLSVGVRHQSLYLPVSVQRYEIGSEFSRSDQDLMTVAIMCDLICCC